MSGAVNLVKIFDSLRKCKKLWIICQRLGREETQAMVRAMETQVQEVELYDVTLGYQLFASHQFFSWSIHSGHW